MFTRFMVRVRVRVRGLPGPSVLDANGHVGSLEVEDQLDVLLVLQAQEFEESLQVVARLLYPAHHRNKSEIGPR